MRTSPWNWGIRRAALAGCAWCCWGAALGCSGDVAGEHNPGAAGASANANAGAAAQAVTAGSGSAVNAGVAGKPNAAAGASGAVANPGGPSVGGEPATNGGEPSCAGAAPTALGALFALAAADIAAASPEAKAIVEQRADGTVVTRGAGRVRGRHELEGTYSPYGALYFENRSYGFEIEDHVAAGQSNVKFTYRPEAPVSANGAQTNFRHFKIYGDGNVFHSNVTMQQVTPRELVFTVTRNAREGRALQRGDVLEFEFGIFIAGNNAGDPDAIEGRNSYYTDTFRYLVGEGGLTADNDDTSGKPGPEPSAWLAGDTTIPWIYAEPELYFSQLALNTQPEQVQAFLRGRRLFHTDFGSGAHSEEGNPVFSAQAGKLGPLTSATGCVSCHERDGRGRLPEVGGEPTTMAVKLYGPAELGNQLQQQEGRARLERFEQREVELGDGSTITLRKPVFAFAGEAIDGKQLAPSVRVARQIPGIGLLEAIPERTILARADEQDCNGDGVTGRARQVIDPESGEPRLGRFGWKAEKVSVAHQVADALEADMGVTTALLPGNDGKVELDRSDFDDLVAYTRLLGLPGRRDVANSQVMRGEELFTEIGCVLCHATDATTGDSHPFVELRGQAIHPYSDLLLHDMGPELADGSGSEQASEWRTAPLWGLGMVETVSGPTGFLHDGRARTPIEAVLWHGGEAEFARMAVTKLGREDRDALLAFLLSL
jgi:CxxC motif-containing protein (DUF1111 family)